MFMTMARSTDKSMPSPSTSASPATPFFFVSRCVCSALGDHYLASHGRVKVTTVIPQIKPIAATGILGDPAPRATVFPGEPANGWRISCYRGRAHETLGELCDRDRIQRIGEATYIITQ